MNFRNSIQTELFKTILSNVNKNDFNGAKKIILECVPENKQAFLKDFEKFPEKILPTAQAMEWLDANIAYGDPIPSSFDKLNWNIAIGDDHVFYVDISCLDNQDKPIKNMLCESMLVLETLSGEDYGYKRLSSECDNWCEVGEKEIKDLKFNGKSIGSRVVYDAFASVVLLEYVFKLQKALAANSNYQKIKFLHSLSSLNDSGNRIKVA